MSIEYLSCRVLISCSLDRFGLIDDFVDDPGLNLGRLDHNGFVVSLVFIAHRELVESTIATGSLFNFLRTIKVLLRKSIVIHPWNPATATSRLLRSIAHDAFVLVDVNVFVVRALC